MNKTTGIVAITVICLMAGIAVAETVRINNVYFTPANEVVGGIQPDMIVSYQLPPYDTFFVVGTVNNASVTNKYGLITDTTGNSLSSVPLNLVYRVSVSP